jgi:hypothetical protein
MMPNPDAPALEDLLVEAATDRAAAPRFLLALLDATVIVPGTVAPAADGQGQTADLATLLGADGSRVQPFYTSEERLSETIAAVPGFQSQFIGLPCRVLFEMTRGATLVLNPHSAYGKEMLPGEIAQLLDGDAPLTPHVVTAGTRVLVGRPASVPPGLEESLADVFARHPEVDEARLGWKVTPPSGEQSYLVTVTGAPDARAAVGGDLSRALAVHSLSAPIDVAYREPGGDDLLTGIPAFYTRSRRGGLRSLFGRRG